jgi:hypothetical protein
VLTSNADTFKTLQVGDKIHLPIEREKREDLKEKAPLKKAGPTPQAHPQTLPSSSPNPPFLGLLREERRKKGKRRK